MATTPKLPSRLHHTAYVTRDLEATRKFYEDLIGLPLLATWCEVDELFGAERVYCHLFFGLGDGGALAFFKFAKPEDEELFGPKMPATPFHHIALNVDKDTQQAIEKRLEPLNVLCDKILLGPTGNRLKVEREHDIDQNRRRLPR